MSALACDSLVAPPSTNGHLNRIEAAELATDLLEAAPPSFNGKISRPGISPEFLRRHGVRHAEGWQTEELLGFKASSGLWIPYQGLSSPELIVNDRLFGRLRLDHPKGGAKYLSPSNSGAQLYIPGGVPFGKELVIVEGEFKSLALCEAGIRAVGIGGISSAMSEGKLIPGLARVLLRYHPKIVYFLGDNDTAFLFECSREAVKLAKALPDGCELRVPRIPLSMPKGIDDCRERLGDGFMDFWREIAGQSVAVSPKLSPSQLAVKLLMPELPVIAAHDDRDEFESRITNLASHLDEVALDKLARAVKDSLGTGIVAFKSAARRKASEGIEDSEMELPLLYFDGVKYHGPSGESYESICREDAYLHLKANGFSGKPGQGADLSPADIAIYKIQTQNRVYYAGPLCGRPAGIHKEGTVTVLATTGPRIIQGIPGDYARIMEYLSGLLGKGPDPRFNDQIFAFIGWLRHARAALRNYRQDMPGQALALVGPKDCGKSLLQTLITLMLGGREVDASLYIVGGSPFNKELWGAEHLRLGDDSMGDDGRERHRVRDHVKKITAANIFPLHAKGKDAESFRPIWRVTISANDDDESITVLPSLDDSFSDKIIYLRCYPPSRPFHDGTEEGRREFWDRLVAEIPALIHQVESVEIPECYLGSSRFYVREFHHPDVVEAINAADAVAPLGELIDEWMSTKSLQEVEGPSAEILGKLATWAGESRVWQFAKSARHFGHQLSRLSRLPGWRDHVSKLKPTRIGGRERNQKVTRWRITRSADIADI
jgi:Domain of unknown function (DUF3854)